MKCFRLRCYVNNSFLVFHQGTKHSKTIKHSRFALVFIPFSRVWIPWWNTQTRCLHITSIYESFALIGIQLPEKTQEGTSTFRAKAIRVRSHYYLPTKGLWSKRRCSPCIFQVVVYLYPYQCDVLLFIGTTYTDTDRSKLYTSIHRTH
jgi:hypothetical protein